MMLKKPRQRWLTMGLLWLAIAGITWQGGTVLEDLGLPAPHLLTGLLVGLVVALTGLGRVSGSVPPLGYTAAQAVAGVLLGTYFNPASLATLAGSWLPLLVVTLATLAFSVGGGVLLARLTGLDRPTAALGMIAGGSAGIVAASDDMDADARLVAFMQYLRLALVVLTAPLLVRFVLAPMGAYEALGPREIEATGSVVTNGAFTVAVALIGAWAGTRLRLPAGALIGPLLLGALASVVGPFQGLTPPEVLRETAFIVIGLQVGLRMDRATVRRAGRLLPPIIAVTLALLVGCGLLGWALTQVTHINLLTTYLATTPGGINAVMVVAFASGANTTLVFAVQTLRLFLMVLAAPPLVRWLMRKRGVWGRAPLARAETDAA